MQHQLVGDKAHRHITFVITPAAALEAQHVITRVRLAQNGIHLRLRHARLQLGIVFCRDFAAARQGDPQCHEGDLFLQLHFSKKATAPSTPQVRRDVVAANNNDRVRFGVLTKSTTPGAGQHQCLALP